MALSCAIVLRLRGVAVLALGAAGGAVVAVWTFGQTGLSDDRVALAVSSRVTSSASRSRSCSSSCWPSSLAITFWVAEHPPNKETRREAGAVILILLALAPIAPCRGARAVRPRTRRLRLEHVADADRPVGVAPAERPGLTAAGSVRARYWNESLKAFATTPGAASARVFTRRCARATARTRSTCATPMATSCRSRPTSGIIGTASLALLASWLASALERDGAAARDRRMPFTPPNGKVVTMFPTVSA